MPTRVRVSLSLLFAVLLGCGDARSVTPAREPTAGAPDLISARASPEARGAVNPAPVVIQTASSIAMLPGLLTRTAKGFPSALERDGNCSFSVGLVGDVTDDYRDLAKHCGTGIGMKPFTESASGKFDAGSHRGDTYDVTMLGGLCYRLLVVGDPTLLEMKMRIEHPDGAVNVMAETKEGVLIVDPKQAWCETEDREFHVLIEASGRSTGAYTLGVWARPAK